MRKTDKVMLLLTASFIVLFIYYLMISGFKTHRNHELVLKTYWIFPQKSNSEKLKLVHKVLKTLRFQTTLKTPWKLLWAQEYPFNHFDLKHLIFYQYVSQFPGTKCITDKILLSKSPTAHVIKTFVLPEDGDKLIAYATNKTILFCKSRSGNDVSLRKISEVNVYGTEYKYISKYIRNPLLIDGYKFDIGVFIVLTSVDPLRLYYYGGDILLRFCTKKYNSHNLNNASQFVVTEDYKSSWDIPTLKRYHKTSGLGTKHAFDMYLLSQHIDSTALWKKIIKSISKIFQQNEHNIINEMKDYSQRINFFQLMRVDLIVTDSLHVKVLQVKQAPDFYNKRENDILYEQLLFNTFRLIGISDHFEQESDDDMSEKTRLLKFKNVAVYGRVCHNLCQINCGFSSLCALCFKCSTEKTKTNMFKAYREHLNRGDFVRLVPPSMSRRHQTPYYMGNLTTENRLNYLWYQGKCDLDVKWCM